MKLVIATGLVLTATVTAMGCGGAPAPSTSEAEGVETPTAPEPGAPAPSGGGATAPGVTAPGMDLPGAPPDPIVEQPIGVEERRILQLVAPKHLEELDRLVGRYARGDARVYGGTFSARDNLGSLGPTYQDGVMTNASVNASLAWEKKVYWNGQTVAGWALSVRGPTHWIRLAQSPTAPGTSSLTIVMPNTASGGMTGSCAECLPALAPTAESLAIPATTARGKWGDGRLLEVTASGTLTRVPTSQLTFERLAAVAEPTTEGRTMKEFKAVASEMVRGVERTHAEATAIPADRTFDSCERITTYKLDWFVDRTNLVRYGLRNMSIAGAQTCCGEGPPGGCTPRTCF